MSVTSADALEKIASTGAEAERGRVLSERFRVFEHALHESEKRAKELIDNSEDRAERAVKALDERVNDVLGERDRRYEEHFISNFNAQELSRNVSTVAANQAEKAVGVAFVAAKEAVGVAFTAAKEAVGLAQVQAKESLENVQKELSSRVNTDEDKIAALTDRMNLMSGEEGGQTNAKTRTDIATTQRQARMAQYTAMAAIIVMIVVGVLVYLKA
jgi:hypothetical protein